MSTRATKPPTGAIVQRPGYRHAVLIAWELLSTSMLRFTLKPAILGIQGLTYHRDRENREVRPQENPVMQK
jgi:hypothetical protein